MIEGMYANSLNRYAQAIASELNEKFSAAIEIDIQPAIDQDRSSYLAAVGGAVKKRRAFWQPIRLFASPSWLLAR